ncbi:DUF998 domain-containing protein [Micromonospora sp. PLK6-60]|uniref:DUF998 domain-containing protein n=1 Tax=Micromonospora sp. PLK6-60 TaxID=2873383 RepID=UPI001CA77409|nr:DUF998 domain-containing protein [Micromonospora sp. PLK6-60]MBY8874132.1 DUF998 domain-containing protein [Micromonospora sp. PLK6-60]
MTTNRLGGLCWLLAGPLFLAANLVTGLGWRRPPYDWTQHNISDLGNVTCGRWDTTRPREVCSPWHLLLNSAAVTTGILLALGVLLAWSALGRGTAVRVTRWLVLGAAGGYLLVGLFPADAHENAHVLGALLIFGSGNLAMPVAALVRRSGEGDPGGGGAALAAVRWASVTFGLLGLVGTALFLAQVDLGFGVGGMERVAVFPLLGWAAIVGARLLRSADRSR